VSALKPDAADGMTSQKHCRKMVLQSHLIERQRKTDPGGSLLQEI
jgi:hypothetical protein